MIIHRIVLLPGSGHAQRVTASGVQKISLRESMQFDRLAAELAPALGLPVVIQEGPVELQTADFVIGLQDALASVLQLAPVPPIAPERCLLLDAARSAALERAEREGLAGVVDERVYAQWLIQHPRAEVALFGLRALLPRLRASASRLPRDTGPNYQRLVADAGRSLPEFLAEYVQLLQRTP